MVPIILAGAAAARMAATPIARMLIRQKNAREAPKSFTVSPSQKPITNVDQLPNHMQPKTTPSSSKGSVRGGGARTAKEGKALKERTKKNRQQIKEVASKSKTGSSAPQKTRRGVEAQAKIDKEIAFQAARKLREAEQPRGSVGIVPRSQKGMSLPGKGGTVKRTRGGPVNARSRAAVRGFRKEQRGG